MRSSMAPLEIAIDFGASNIKAFRLSDGKLWPVKLNKEQYAGDHAPNCLYYKKLKKSDGWEALIGSRAREEIRGDEANGVRDIKRRLESENWRKFIPVLNREIGIGEAATQIFASILKLVQPQEGQPVEAVLTAPVSFSGAQIRRLRKAAADAGIQVRHVLTEPFAALFSLADLEKNSLLLVFDFGGSTLDISVSRMESDGGRIAVTELAAEGLRLGGYDIDEAICRELLDPALVREYAAATEYRGDEEVARQSLLENIAARREEMYREDGEEADISFEPPLILKRTELEKLLATEQFAGRIRATLDTLFTELQEGPEALGRQDIDFILPVGGLLQMPVFARLLEEYFGADRFNAQEFDYENTDMLCDGIESRYMAVAGGAARYLQLCRDAEVEFTSALPFQLGFMNGKKFIPCIAKNTPRGGSYRSLPKPLSPQQLEADDWSLRVFQCFANPDNDEPIFVDKIALNKDLYLPDQPVMVAMNMEHDGKLRVVISQRQVFDEEDDSGEVEVETRYLEI